MGMFKSKKSSATVSSGSIPKTDPDGFNRSHKKKKFPFLKQKKGSNNNDQVAAVPTSPGVSKAADNTEPSYSERQQERDNQDATLETEAEETFDLGDIPRSISTPSRDDDRLLPPPQTPGGAVDDGDSIGSPCESMLKHSKQKAAAAATSADNSEAAAKAAELSKLITSAPTLDQLPRYISALSEEVSPDPSADLPSRALRCLFSLSEHSSHKAQRIAMVKWGDYYYDGKNNAVATEEAEDSKPDNGKTSSNSTSLVPALLSFLTRCPRDSSEQYLTLLVLNNLSIPTQNKRLIALVYEGAKTLGRLLCEDPGCHLLVIIIVNLTFGDEELNHDLLVLGSVQAEVGVDESGEDGGKEEKKKRLSWVGDVQLVDSLAYALLLASLTTEQLATLGPIPLTSPEGVPHSPRRLLSLLFALLESKLGIWYQNIANAKSKSDGRDDNEALPLSLGGDDCPFPETARWCLSALKNLTRPGKLFPFGIDATNNNKDEMAVVANGNKDASAVAAQAIIDAGILPLLLRILKHKEDVASAAKAAEDGSTGSTGYLYNWQSNSAQDAALYTLMHMMSVPQVRRVLRDECDAGCAEVLVSILNYGKVISEKLLKNNEVEDKELGQSSLQCLKARMALSYLALGTENNNNASSATAKYGSANTLADHEVQTLVELLSNSLAGRAKDGLGGYSAATFSLKGVLFGIKCILSESKNRQLFLESANDGKASRLNSLLLKAVARFALQNEATSYVMDAETVENAVVCLYWMSLYGLDEAAIEFVNPLLGGLSNQGFLPVAFGGIDAKGILAKVLVAYLNSDGITRRGQHAANQILFRVNYLRFEGSAADMIYPEKPFPCQSDFDLNDQLVSAIQSVSVKEWHNKKGDKPKEYIFDRSIARHEKQDGPGSKVFSFGQEAMTPSMKSFPSALEAAEEFALQQPMGGAPTDDIAMANNIAYYADGLDVYCGFVWKWEDGNGDTIERIYSAEETVDQMIAEEVVNDSTERSEPYSPPRKGLLGRLKLPTVPMDDNEPFSIFGLRCGAPMCGKGY